MAAAGAAPMVTDEAQEARARLRPRGCAVSQRANARALRAAAPRARGPARAAARRQHHHTAPQIPAPALRVAPSRAR
jgi:hypothetical protein